MLFCVRRPTSTTNIHTLRPRGINRATESSKSVSTFFYNYRCRRLRGTRCVSRKHQDVPTPFKTGGLLVFTFYCKSTHYGARNLNTKTHAVGSGGRQSTCFHLNYNSEFICNAMIVETH